MISPKIIHNLLSDVECKILCTFIQQCAAQKLPIKVYSNSSRRTEVSYRDMASGSFRYEAVNVVQRARQRCFTNALILYGKKPLYIEFTLLAGNYCGDSHILHADNKRYDTTINTWVPNHTPDRVFSGLLYLNQGGGLDFQGGNIKFPQYDLTIIPAPGTAVLFPSDENFLHEVEPVISGARYSIASWYTANVTMNEEALVRC